MMKRFLFLFPVIMVITIIGANAGNLNFNFNSDTYKYILNPNGNHCLENIQSNEVNLQLFPWLVNSQEMMMPACPGPINVVAAQGACSAVVTFDLDLQPVNPPVQMVVTQTVSDSVVATIFCPFGQTKFRRTFQNNGFTALKLNTLRLGVYESFNNPQVKVNVYNNTGILLGTTNTIVPGNINMGHFNFPLNNISIPSGQSYDIEVVTPPPFVSVFKIGRNDAGHLSGFSEAIISSPSCTQAELLVSGAVNANAIVMQVLATPDEFKVENLSLAPLNILNSGDAFPIGTSNMSYRVTNAAGNIILSCDFPITVASFNSGNTAIACNDLVQISMDDDCNVTVSSAQILQGDFYGCYDQYIVNITSLNGGSLGNTVTQNQIGQTLNVTVTAPNGNNCWGQIHVEDKLGPNLICEDVFTTCVGPLTPGAPISTRVNIPAIITDGVFFPGAPSQKSFTIPVNGLGNAVISDLNVYLDISHTRVSDLVATLAHPNGTSITLFVSPGATAIGGPCTGDNLNITLDDEAANTYLNLRNNCEPVVPTISGSFRPLNLLSAFDNQNANGDWVLTVYDVANGEGGTVNHIDLIFTQTGATIPFPTPKPVTSTYVNENTYVVQGIDNCTSATLSYTDVTLQEDCIGIYAKVIRRCWNGQDAYGNNANECCQTIYVYRNGLSTLVFPPNYDDIDLPALSCLDYGDTVPGTDITGLPSGDLCYNVQIVPHTDVRLDICKRSYKIIRTHKVLEWCSGQVLTHNQVIKVKDDQGPELECPDDITVSTDSYDCTATVVIEKPEIFEECSDILTYHLSYAFDPFNSFEPEDLTYSDIGVFQAISTITGMPEGVSYIRWEVGDECGNTSVCYSRVLVEDQVNPTAVCDLFTVASVGGNGVVVVDALTFDDGSHDNCGIKEISVRKMTNACVSGNTLFGPTAVFCCAEVGNAIQVEFRVTDFNNNSNTCMVQVSVQDKLPPYITKCPPNITIDCQEDYNDFSITGEPTVVDNCSVVDVKNQDTPVINQCGNGIVTRVWTVTDKQDLKHSCVQTITLQDADPFKESDIIWPLNYETVFCGADLDPTKLPVAFAFPRVDDDNCSLVAIHYKDQVFKFVDGACEKILRTWTVLDWCTYNESNPVLGQGWYEKVQILKMHNDIAPVIESPCSDKTVGSYGNCEGEVEEIMSAFDDCTEDLVWSYRIDLFNDGTINLTGSTNRFKLTLPDGVHKIIWTVEDNCGNKTVCEYLLTVVDAKKPSPYCLTSITTAVMNSNGNVEIWARDYDLGSFDNCTQRPDLWFTFDGATPVLDKIGIQHFFKGNGQNATEAEYLDGLAQKWIPGSKSSGILFDCDDLLNGISQEVWLNMTVTDLAKNQDFCTIKLIIQDNANVCPDQDNSKVAINGKVLTPDSRVVKNVTLALTSNFPENNKSILSNQAGNFVFQNLPKNVNYAVDASYNGHFTEGVSTIDLVFIQRHILGLDPFNNAYKMVAADIDNNQKVNTADLVSLRKAILGISSEYPNGQKSWRFLPDNQTFSNVNNPFPYTENYVYNNLTQNKANQNFVAVKIGDINQSIVLNVEGDPVEVRSNQKLVFATPTIDAQKGEIVKVPFYAAGFDQVFGYQFTGKFDQNVFDFESIEASNLQVSEDNFGLNRIENGYFTTCWFDENPMTFQEDDVLFFLVLKARKNVQMSQVVKIDSEITRSVAFDANGKEMNIVWNVRTEGNAEGNQSFELMQNVPNPFNNQTKIEYFLPNDSHVKLSITDVTGKLILTKEGFFTAGINQFILDKSDINYSGMLYYRIDAGKDFAIKKMIVIE